MSFDDWCYQKGIIENRREALFHLIMATCAPDKVEDPDEWESAWEELKQQLMELNFMNN